MNTIDAIQTLIEEHDNLDPRKDSQGFRYGNRSPGIPENF